MILYVLYHENGQMHGIWAFGNFSSKFGGQKYSAWVPGNPTPSSLCSVLSLSEET